MLGGGEQERVDQEACGCCEQHPPWAGAERDPRQENKRLDRNEGRSQPLLVSVPSLKAQASPSAGLVSWVATGDRQQARSQRTGPSLQAARLPAVLDLLLQGH